MFIKSAASVAICLVVAMSLAGTARAQSAPPSPHQSGRQDMVVADRPEAAEAARAILRQGGSAVDAAIAAMLVLNLVEPQSAGIGGGGFLLDFDAASGAIEAFDGRETAPATATPDQFLNPDGTPMTYADAVPSGLSVGVPGLLRMAEAAHKRHGKLPWAELFKPAIALAENGFEIGPRLARLLADDRFLRANPAAAALYYRQGEAKPAGTKIVNPALAMTLRAITAGGVDVFYQGAIARDIVAAVHAHKRPGRLGLGDLAQYNAPVAAALCEPYRIWLICGAPPTAGGITVLEIMGLLERYEIGKMAPLSLAAVHLIAEASRLAYADRDEYVADPHFASVPVAGLLSSRYLATRAHAISPARSFGRAKPGEPAHASLWPYAPSHDREYPTTTHISVVDRDGNAVATTISIESAFGARIMVDGFLLNNELTDFSFRPETDGKPIANRVQAGKRPRSAMSPTLVFDGSGKLVLAVGSPGGQRIIDYVADTLVAALDWQLPIDQAVALPHVVNRNGLTEIEKGSVLESLASELTAMGHEVATIPFDSGLNAIAVKDGVLEGAADPRREGAAAGD